jgi:hypothetical protein
MYSAQCSLGRGPRLAILQKINRAALRHQFPSAPSFLEIAACITQPLGLHDQQIGQRKWMDANGHGTKLLLIGSRTTNLRGR